MEKAIQISIYIHAAFGTLASLAGLIAMIAKKGKIVHKKAGLIFFYSMITSGIIAMIVSVLPNHESPFLFAVGIFSLYFVLSGNRALGFKEKKHDIKVDKLISWTMIVTGILMIFAPIILTKSINIILLVFAVIGIIFSIRDLILLKNQKNYEKDG